VKRSGREGRRKKEAEGPAPPKYFGVEPPMVDVVL